MTKTLILLTAVLSLVNLSLKGQSLLNYSSSLSNSSYSSISGSGTLVKSWRNTTASPEDDNRSNAINIGFDFWYNGVRYTQFSVSTNGYIDFSSSAATGGPVATAFGYDNTSFTASNPGGATRPAIAAFYDDLTTQGTNDPLNTSIRYQLSGAIPNRTLTVEWINLGVYLNSTPSLNFQVQLFEGTGGIAIHYGTMTSGTQLFSYSTGLNAATVSSPPASSQLKMLQAANTNNFSNGIQNNLSAMPAAGTRYEFTPPSPLNPSGSLSFGNVTASSMSLNWSDWASNETCYAIYNSTDGINYTFVSQTAANAATANITGLKPGTVYYWKVFAITEGWISSPLTGTQATGAAGNKISNNSGNWSAANTWLPNGVPTATDNVTIANGNVVQINGNAQCNNITVGGGASGSLQFNNGGTGYSLIINNDVTVNPGGSFFVPMNSNATSSITIRGNVVNNGTLNLNSDFNSRVVTTFSNNSNVSVTGTGALTSFYTINMSIGSNTLDVNVPTFSATTGFLNIPDGTFKLTSSNAATLTPFTASTVIRSTAGLWLNASASTFSIPATLSLNGSLSLLSGTVNMGSSVNQDLAITGGSLTVSGGALNVAGKLYSGGVNNLCYVSISGGTVTVPTYSSTNISTAPFDLNGTGSQFNMSGGTIIIQREGGSGAQDLGYVNKITSGSVTGGTLQIGNAATPVSSTLNINSVLPVGNLVVNSANATAKLLTNSLTVLQNVSLTSGNLNANNLNITLGGNWSNNGGIFTPGTSLVTFSSGSAQSLFRTGGETFNHLLFTGAGVKTFSSSVTANGNFTVASGSSVDVSPSNHTLTVKGDFSNNGTFLTRTGLVAFTGTVSQSVGGSSVTDFYDMTLGNSLGAYLAGPENLRGTLTLTAGTLSTNNNLTMVSTSTATARIAQITGSGDITGNVTVQRFIPGGTTGWAFLGSPISSGLTLSDWDDDIAISCSTCPDGSAGGFLSIYTYDESVSGAFDNYLSYIPLSTINDPIIPGKGYWVYMGTALYNTADITMDVTGTVRKFNYTIPLSYTNYGSQIDDGWNLIQNPYPSPISWTSLKGSTANIDDAIYVWNADLNGGTGGYASYVNGVSSPAQGSGGIGNTIPMWQGFYVHSTGATALNITESVKTAGNPTFLKSQSSPSPQPLMRLRLQRNSFDDETVLYFNPGATDNFDEEYDSYKMHGEDTSAPFIALEKNGKEFQINGIAPVSGNFSMPLKTITGYPGTYTISISELSNFPQGACISLYDNFTNISTDLKTSSYVYTLSDTTTVARFTLNITIDQLNTTDNVAQPSCAQPGDGKITVSGTNNGPWNYYWTANGVAVKTSLNKSTADTLSNLFNGVYKVEVNTVGMCDNKTDEYQINGVTLSTAAFIAPDTLDLLVNATATFTNTSQNSVSYTWDFGDGSPVTSAFEPVHTYTSSGIYTATLKVWSISGCSDSSSRIITVVDPVGISEVTAEVNSVKLKTLADNEYSLVLDFAKLQTVRCTLYDLQGRMLKDYGTQDVQNLELNIDLSDYAKGLYLFNFSCGNDNKTLKLPVK